MDILNYFNCTFNIRNYQNQIIYIFNFDRIEEKLKGYPNIIHRNFIPCNGSSNDVRLEFRVMQFNGLAKNLGNTDKFKTLVPESVNWDKFRMWRLLEELIRYNCDIICIEEADFYDEIKYYLHFIG